MVQVKIVKAWLKKWRHNRFVPWSSCETWWPWMMNLTSSSSSSMYEDDDEDYIPRDVPKGHLVVYVGENQSRFVIHVKVLKNPLFNALLDQDREEYDFNAGSRLCIPCNEEVFHSVLHCNQRFMSCM